MNDTVTRRITACWIPVTNLWGVSLGPMIR